MKFEETFSLDTSDFLAVPKIMSGFVSSAGSFAGGLLTVLDQSLSSRVLSSWRWLLGQDAIALVASSLGDLFFWSEKHGAIYFLDVQRGSSTFVDKQVGWFFNEFLTADEMQNKVLHRPLFESLSKRLLSLNYGDCFIAEPWVRLGGSGREDTYTKGSLTVYANLVGQTVEQAMRGERARLH
jgi:hypothetical protein